MTQTIERQNKALVPKAFDALFHEKDCEAAEAFWSLGYVQHSAHIPPGRDGLFNVIKNGHVTLRYENGRIFAEGDKQMLHARFSGLATPKARSVLDIVRVEAGCLAAHWDIAEDEADKATSVSGMSCSAIISPPNRLGRGGAMAAADEIVVRRPRAALPQLKEPSRCQSKRPSPIAALRIQSLKTCARG
jgi:predicted SnoaL-like aldol condensation-catalyzing enzyme